MACQPPVQWPHQSEHKFGWEIMLNASCVQFNSKWIAISYTDVHEAFGGEMTMTWRIWIFSQPPSYSLSLSLSLSQSSVQHPLEIYARETDFRGHCRPIVVSIIQKCGIHNWNEKKKESVAYLLSCHLTKMFQFRWPFFRRTVPLFALQTCAR